jgi:hypothetical protein
MRRPTLSSGAGHCPVLAAKVFLRTTLESRLTQHVIVDLSLAHISNCLAQPESRLSVSGEKLRRQSALSAATFLTWTTKTGAPSRNGPVAAPGKRETDLKENAVRRRAECG